MMKTPLFLFVATLVLAACQGSVLLRSDSSHAVQARELRLLQALTVKPETTRVFIQDGEVFYHASQTNPYRPRCAFEVRTRLENAEQTIQAGNFSVLRVQSVMDDVVDAGPMMLAGFRIAGIDDGGAPMVHAGYHFWLDSDQVNLMRLTCYGVFDHVGQVEPPSVEDIQRTLGRIAELVVER